MELTTTQLHELKMDADDVQAAIREYLAARSEELKVETSSCVDASVKWRVAHIPGESNIRFSGAIVSIRS